METNLDLGRVGGIRVGVHWSVLVIWWLLTSSLATSLLPDAAGGESTLVYWSTATVAAVALLGCLLTHELSHAAVARRHGVRTRSITLWALGGVAALEDEAPTPSAELRIAAAGPVTSAVLAAVAFTAALAVDAIGVADVVVACLAWLAAVNLVLAVFNLAPGIPLDGGRILHAVLWSRCGDRVRATASAARAGRGVGFVLVGVGVLEVTAGSWGGLWLVLVGWFLVSAATVERDYGGLRVALSGITVGDVMTPDPVTVPSTTTIESLIDEFMLGGRHTSFPVVSETGAVVGLVGLAEVRTVPGEDRRTTTVGSVATPLARAVTASRSEPLAEVVSSLSADIHGRSRRILVVDPDDGRVTGIMTPTDIARAIDIGALVHA